MNRINVKDIIEKNRDRLSAGVISDTHGTLVPQALKALTGVDLIIHAGDIDTPAVLVDLKRIAPVIAVRGNMDRGDLASLLNETETIEIGANLIYVLHDVNRLDVDLKATGINIVIHGHKHRPSDALDNGIRFLNPGSASDPRANSHPSLLRLYFTETSVGHEFIFLE